MDAKYILVDEVNGQAFGPFDTTADAMHVVETGEGAGDVPWGGYGWSIVPLTTPERKGPQGLRQEDVDGILEDPTEVLRYRGVNDAADPTWDAVVRVSYPSVRGVDDMVWSMDGGTPLVKVLDKWFAKEVGMRRV